MCIRDRAYTGLYQGYEARSERWGQTRRFYNPLIAPLERFETGYTVGRDAGRLLVGTRGAVLELSLIHIFMPHVASGKLRALAVAADQRLPSAPQVPAAGEAGDAGLQISSWNAFFAPAGTPPAVLEKLNAALRQTLASPELKTRLAAQGTQLYTGAPDEYQRFIAAEKKKWAEIVKRADIRMD